ncbi:hypothetical protein GOBAR_AA17287 [Gossypium barbadense]|uniref:Uncharacterized protein n=1 Tax=Gossypium barbadense TaxID=3634 RepID=A0A2P5XJ55_GOSBA|nr:hypothetical protein GOBAR_AA17287 [Gossypium barbadense]
MRNLQHFLVTTASVQKGVPAPGGHNSCTNIPRRNDPPCINQMGFAGHVMAPPRLQPGQRIPFNTAA